MEAMHNGNSVQFLFARVLLWLMAILCRAGVYGSIARQGGESSGMEPVSCNRYHTQSDGKLHAGAWKSYKIWNKIAHRLKIK